MEIPDYPSNSHKANDHPKDDDISEKKVDKVIKGKVVTQKKGIGEKFAETFLAEDVNSVKVYFWQDVFVPTVKKLFADGISDAVHMLFLGSPYSGSRPRTPSSTISYGQRTAYTPYSSGRPTVVDRSQQSGYSYDNIKLETRADAEEVLINLDEIISRYGMASIADLYDLVGINSRYTDNNYGWTNISTATTIRTADGWLLKMPKATPIK